MNLAIGIVAAIPGLVALLVIIYRAGETSRTIADNTRRIDVLEVSPPRGFDKIEAQLTKVDEDITWLRNRIDTWMLQCMECKVKGRPGCD